MRLASLVAVLSIFNEVFTWTFAVEMVIKQFALGKTYFSSGWNVFDFFIVMVSLYEKLPVRCAGTSIPNISVRVLATPKPFLTSMNYHLL